MKKWISQLSILLMVLFLLTGIVQMSSWTKIHNGSEAEYYLDNFQGSGGAEYQFHQFFLNWYRDFKIDKEEVQRMFPSTGI